MYALNAVSVCRSYGRDMVLKDFSLAVEPGRFEALMGPSGSGKSTFLHIAAGLLSSDSGSVEVAGRDITAMGDSTATRFRRRNIGIVFQAFNLLNEKTVGENILLPLRLDGAKIDGAVRSRLAALAEKLGLASKLDAKPETLSGGEQQRAAIARALLSEPAIVLADEPTGNLDAKSARATCALLKELNETEKSAILVVTHDPMVAACASKVHFLVDGKIAASCETNGDPARISKLYLEICK